MLVVFNLWCNYIWNILYPFIFKIQHCSGIWLVRAEMRLHKCLALLRFKLMSLSVWFNLILKLSAQKFNFLQPSYFLIIFLILNYLYRIKHLFSLLESLLILLVNWLFIPSQCIIHHILRIPEIRKRLNLWCYSLIRLNHLRFVPLTFLLTSHLPLFFRISLLGKWLSHLLLSLVLNLSRFCYHCFLTIEWKVVIGNLFKLFIHLLAYFPILNLLVQLITQY